MKQRLLIKISYLFLSVGIVTLPAFGVTFTISEKDINSMVQKAFPQKKQYQGANIFFSDPIVSLDGLEHTIRIQTTITAIREQQLVKAVGELSGQLYYDPIDYQLQLKKPALSEFKVIESTMEDANTMIRGMRDVVGQSLPLIVLFDLEQYDLGFGTIRPESIEIKQRKLVISL